MGDRINGLGDILNVRLRVRHLLRVTSWFLARLTRCRELEQGSGRWFFRAKKEEFIFTELDENAGKKNAKHRSETENCI